MTRPAAHRLPDRERPDASARTSPDAIVCNAEVIAPRDQPLGPEGGVAVLRGNLAPQGAVIKHTAVARSPPADPRRPGRGLPQLQRPRGADRRSRICRSRPIPCWCCRTPARSAARACRNGACCRFRRRSWRSGIRDMVRLSDARMSGTSYGTCVLHIAPESFVGGPLAFVRDGDIIELDVPGRRLTLQVPDEELARRRADWTPARTPLSTRLRPPLLPARHPGRQGVRFRLPGRDRADSGAGDSLSGGVTPGVRVRIVGQFL